MSLGAFVLAVPLAVLWMGLTNQLNLGGFGVGYILGIAVLFLQSEQRVKVDLTRIPLQMIAFVEYMLVLAWDIFKSSVDVAQRVVKPHMPLRPGIIAVETQDRDNDEFMAALSSHAITVTPGQLVVAFDGGSVMFVHCLDAEGSAEDADIIQRRRMERLRRIRGLDPER